MDSSSAHDPRRRTSQVGFRFLLTRLHLRSFSALSLGFALSLVGALIFLYATLSGSASTRREIEGLQARVGQAQQEIHRASDGDSPVEQERRRLLAVQEDFQTVRKLQVPWSQVLSTVSAAPGGVTITSVSQDGLKLSISGTAPNYAALVQYLDHLHNTDLFVDNSVQLATEAGIAADPGKTNAVPTIILSSENVAGTGGTPTKTPTKQPTPGEQPRSVVAVPPARTNGTGTSLSKSTMTATPTSSPTPTITATTTPTATPTPRFDYVVIFRKQIAQANPDAHTSDIRVRVVDAQGHLVPGMRFRISSEGEPPWSAEGPEPGQADGTASFNVTRGTFRVVVLDGASEAASALYTGANGVPGSYGYEIVFQETGRQAPNGTSTATSTRTATPSPHPTRVGAGEDVIRTRSATAHASKNDADAHLAIDGNLDTVWSAGTGPVVDFWIDLPEAIRLEGVEFVVEQFPSGATRHELWVQNEDGTYQLIHTFIGETETLQVLGHRFSSVRSVRQVWMRTLNSPSHVAWREIRAYAEVPPPGQSTTQAPAPTPAPGSLSSRSALTVDDGLTITASSRSNDAYLAIDGLIGAPWLPSQDNRSSLQYLRITMPGTYQVEALELFGYQDSTSTPSVAIRVAGTNVPLQSYASGNEWHFWRKLEAPQPAELIEVEVWGGVMGWREVRIYAAPPPPSPTSTATSTAESTSTPPPTITPTQTSSPTPTLTPTPTITPTPTNTPTPSPTATWTPAAQPANSGPDPQSFALFFVDMRELVAGSRGAELAPTPPPGGPIRFTITVDVRPGRGYR